MDKDFTMIEKEVNDYEPKKLLILRILEILTEYSDCDHPLTQAEIIKYLKSDFNIVCERKAVARNIEYLTNAGYDIVSDRGSGVYLAGRKFENGELRLLIDAVLSNRNICDSHTKDLVKKLSSEGGKYFKSYAKHVARLDDWQKADSRDYILNIEYLCEAIDKKIKIKFNYVHYGVDKKIHKKHAESQYVNPYQLFVKNGRYYLACNYEKYNNIAYCRVDRITDIELLPSLPVKPLDSFDGCKNGIDLGRIANKLPYLFDDGNVRIEFLAKKDLLDEIFDSFGLADTNVSLVDNDTVKVSLVSSLGAMRYWCFQFGKSVTVLSPQSLVDTIKDDIEKMRENYAKL